MSEPQPIRILIADDHPVVREGLAAMIQSRPSMTVVGLAADGSEAVALYRQQRPDVTLMDLRMPVMDGVTAIETIRAEFPGARLIVLTTYDGDADIYRALRAGAQAYLLKDTGGEELLAAIGAVHAGRRHVPPEVAAKLAEYVSGPQLTAREIEVLRLMAAGMSNQEIGAALFIAEGTVKAHINSILTKLDVSDRTQAVTAALRRGLVSLE